MRNTLIIFMAILLTGCQKHPQPVFNPNRPHLKMITYNVNWGFVYPENVINFISQNNADIIFLQETHRYWQRALESEFAGSYPYRVFHEFGGAGGIAIMSKYKLEDIKVIEPNDGWFPALYACVQTPVGNVQLLNVHLRPPLSDQGSVAVSAYYNAPVIHVKELKGFLKDTSADKPLIIAGDFNENENKEAVLWLKARQFTDALSIYDQKSPTWMWKAPLITLKNRYDHIMLSRHLNCTGAEIVKVAASDHMPVIAVITPK